MWHLKRTDLGPMPQLPLGRSYYAVIDVEALVTPKVDIVEQVGFVLVDALGREVLGEKHMIFQPFNADQIARRYAMNPAEVYRAVAGYRLVTRDNYVHDYPQLYGYKQWGPVRKRITQICRQYAAATFAKGMELEYRVFFGEIPFLDLAWWGAPKYPNEIHDPLSECRFFSQFIPDLQNRPVYIC